MATHAQVQQAQDSGSATDLSIEQVEDAINHYRRAHELPQNVVSMDASLSSMAHVYGTMIATRASVLQLAAIDAEVAALFLKWVSAS